MGMFDSFIAPDGQEWQTKAFDRQLDVWRVGDPFPADGCVSFQAEVIGSEGSTLGGTYRSLDAFVTVRDNVVTEIPATRDPARPLVGYAGGLANPATAHIEQARQEVLEERAAEWWA